MAREVEQIKERIDLVEFIRGYIDLKPAGKNLKAICPFHQERTPSFIVSPERGSWHCFGACGEGGDVFSFFMKYENLEFHEALKVLAERAGVPLQQINPRQQKEFGILYDLNELAKNFYREELKKNKQALDYLKERGLKDETIEEFELGFAPGGESLTLHLIKKGHEVADLERAGLAVKNRQGLYRDKFFGRIIFPIWNSVDKAVAFTGRITPWAEKRPDFDAPKYLNSPETPIFNKSKILYGFHKSKNEIARAKQVFFVEGQMDFLMSWQSGIKNAVAISGTALSQYHLEKIRRLADTAILSFDNDEAGRKAVERGLDIFGNFDFHVRVIDLGDFGDPADAVRADPDFLGQALGRAEPAFRFLFKSSFMPEILSNIPERKRLVAHYILKIKALKSPTEQNIWISELSKYAGVAEIFILAEFEKAQAKSNTVGESQTATLGGNTHGPLAADRLEKIARRLVILASGNDEFMALLEANVQWIPNEYRNLLTDERARSELGMEASFETGKMAADAGKNEFHKLLFHLKSEQLKRKQEELRLKIRAAQESGGGELAAIMNDFYFTSRQLDALR